MSNVASWLASCHFGCNLISPGLADKIWQVYSGLVARRNYRLSHGVGRSGDVAEVQPKAAGSSLLAKLAHALARDALRLAGLGSIRAALVLPMATG